MFAVSQLFINEKIPLAVQSSIGRVLVNGRDDRYRNGTERDRNGKKVLPFCTKRFPVFPGLFEWVQPEKYPFFTVYPGSIN